MAHLERRLTDQSPEGGVTLRAVESTAATIKDAGDAVQGMHAGQAELDWVIAHPQDARRMLQGDYYFFFPGAANGNNWPYVHWAGNTFTAYWNLSSFRWTNKDRIVTSG